jgi:hypothetical protein
MSAPSISIHGDQYSSWRWVPLLTPAVKQDSCNVDHDLLFSRIYTIAIAIIGTAGILSAVFPAAIIAIPLFPILSMGIVFLDMWIAERAANVKAVNEYLKMSYPSKSATFRIQHNFKAAQLLIDKMGDLNKINEEGLRLLEYAPDINVFELLTSHGANIKTLDKNGISYFERAVANENPAYLDSILRNSLVKPEDFNPTEQIKFWTNLGSVKAAYLLKQFGFNVNVRDNEGYTPLLRVVKDHALIPFRMVRKLGIEAHVTTLLNCGADRSITVLEAGIEKNAMQINTDPAVRMILEQT